MKINPIHSAQHSISCNYNNPIWSHSRWALQLSKTIDLDITVQVDSMSCNCKRKWVRGNTVSCNCNKKQRDFDETNPMRKVIRYRVTEAVQLNVEE